jgi:two-component system sensor histidine kinase MtrB
MAVAVALPTRDGAYVEVFPAEELDQNLRSLGAIFVGTTTATTALGLLLGRWASHRSLQPLTAVTAAAAAIAEGDLDARLDGRSDPDLMTLARAFNTTAAKLQARIERDARFAANVSHELRSPLTILVNAVEVLCQRADPLDPETREVLHLLADNVHRLARTVNDLLEISRLDADAVDLHREMVPLGRCVQTVADRCAGRPVTVLDHRDGPLMAVDKRRMERIIENLVQNAETHGGGTMRVSVVADGQVVRILVDDNGSGIPAGLRTRIFERFARGPRSDTEPGGSGLGLALVAEHVRLHHGRVWAEDAPGGGARFVVELPQETR